MADELDADPRRARQAVAAPPLSGAVPPGRAACPPGARSSSSSPPPSAAPPAWPWCWGSTARRWAWSRCATSAASAATASSARAVLEGAEPAGPARPGRQGGGGPAAPAAGRLHHLALGVPALRGAGAGARRDRRGDRRPGRGPAARDHRRAARAPSPAWRSPSSPATCSCSGAPAGRPVARHPRPDPATRACCPGSWCMSLLLQLFGLALPVLTGQVIDRVMPARRPAAAGRAAGRAGGAGRFPQPGQVIARATCCCTCGPRSTPG